MYCGTYLDMYRTYQLTNIILAGDITLIILENFFYNYNWSVRLMCPYYSKLQAVR